jgi:hypothetical protein
LQNDIGTFFTKADLATEVVFAQYTGDSRYAMLHLDRVKEECWDSVSLNTSLWTREFAVPAPPIHIVDTLCSNDCSGHGHCSKGKDHKIIKRKNGK